MGRFPQSPGQRGSKKWIQIAVNQPDPRLLDRLILSELPGATGVEWQSPLRSDDFAEYRDGSFLDKIGAAALEQELKKFWPSGGPQWDALGKSDAGDLLIVEAKAHIDEIFSSPTRAEQASRVLIDEALKTTALSLNATPRAVWAEVFYQLANRLAHLYFLKRHNRKARLVLVNFIGDHDIHGPSSAAEWEAAYKVVWHVLGVPGDSPSLRDVIHVYPVVADFGVATS